MKELKKITAQVRAILAKYGSSKNLVEMTVAMETIDLDGNDVVKYKISLRFDDGYKFADGDSFKTALQRLELSFIKPDIY